jgi:hypothetical protein
MLFTNNKFKLSNRYYDFISSSTSESLYINSFNFVICNNLFLNNLKYSVRSFTVCSYSSTHSNNIEIMGSRIKNNILKRNLSVIKELAVSKPTYSLIVIPAFYESSKGNILFNSYVRGFSAAYKPVTTASQVLHNCVEVCFSFIVANKILNTDFCLNASQSNISVTLPANLHFVLDTFFRFVQTTSSGRVSPSTLGRISSTLNLTALLNHLFGDEDSTLEDVLILWKPILSDTVFSTVLSNRNHIFKMFIEQLKFKIELLFSYEVNTLAFYGFISNFYNSLNSSLRDQVPLCTMNFRGYNNHLNLHKFTSCKVNASKFFIHFSALNSFTSSNTETGLLILLGLFEPRFYRCSSEQFSNPVLAGNGLVQDGQFTIDVSSYTTLELYLSFFSLTATLIAEGPGNDVQGDMQPNVQNVNVRIRPGAGGDNVEREIDQHPVAPQPRVGGKTRKVRPGNLNGPAIDRNSPDRGARNYSTSTSFSNKLDLNFSKISFSFRRPLSFGVCILTNNDGSLTVIGQT